MAATIGTPLAMGQCVMTQPIPNMPPLPHVPPSEEPLPHFYPVEEPPVRHDPNVYPPPAPVEEPQSPAPDPRVPPGPDDANRPDYAKGESAKDSSKSSGPS